MKPLHFFVPFSAIERSAAAARGYDPDWVTGHAFVNETVDGEGGIALKKFAMKEASEEYRKWGNVREMHGKNAAGVVKMDEWDDTGWFVGIDVVDKQAKEKVDRGVYKGLSVGVQPLLMRGKDVTKCKIVEISLVDRPKDPEALLTAYRAEGYDPHLATDVEVEGGEEALKRRLPGHSPLDTPEAISAGSTYYGVDPEQVGICAVVEENGHYCVYGPDGQKLGEFPTMAEARARAREVTESMKSELDVDGDEYNKVGTPGQDQNAGPLIKQPNAQLGEDQKRALESVVIREGDPILIQRDKATGRFQLYRADMSQMLFEAETREEVTQFIVEAVQRAETSAMVPVRENLEGKAPKKKVDRDKDEADDDQDEEDEDAEEKAEAGQDAIEDAAKAKKKKAKAREKALEEAKEKAEEAKERALALPDGDEKRLALSLVAAAEAALEAEERAMTLPIPGSDPTLGGLPAPMKEQQFTDSLSAAGSTPATYNNEGVPFAAKRAYPEENVAYADDANMKFPLDTEVNIRAAWQQVTHADFEKTHSPTEMAAMKSKIKRAAEAKGIALDDPDAALRGEGIVRCCECAMPMDSGLILAGPAGMLNGTKPPTFAESLKAREGSEKASLAWNILRDTLWSISWEGAPDREARSREAIRQFEDYVAPLIGAAETQRGELFAIFTRSTASDLERHIVNENGRWVLYSLDGKKKLGTFETKEEAQAREREIDYFKGGKRDGEPDAKRGDGSPDEHPLAQAHRVEDVEEFFLRLARVEDENLTLLTRCESAQAEIARVLGTVEEQKKLLVSAEAQIERLERMPAPTSRINTPVLFPEALPRTFIANRRDQSTARREDLEKRIAAVMELPPTNDAGEQNRRAQEIMVIKTQIMEVFQEQV